MIIELHNYGHFTCNYHTSVIKNESSPNYIPFILSFFKQMCNFTRNKSKKKYLVLGCEHTVSRSIVNLLVILFGEFYKCSTIIHYHSRYVLLPIAIFQSKHIIYSRRVMTIILKFRY